MTQQQKDNLNEWLSGRFPILSKNDIYLIVMHIEHYFIPSEQKIDGVFDDEHPDYIKMSQEEI